MRVWWNRVVAWLEGWRHVQGDLRAGLAERDAAEARVERYREALAEELEDAEGRLHDSTPGSMGAIYQAERVKRLRAVLSAAEQHAGTERELYLAGRVERAEARLARCEEEKEKLRAEFAQARDAAIRAIRLADA